MNITLNSMEGEEITLTGEGFDIHGWVSVCIGEKCKDVHINELYPAVVGLRSKYLEEKDL